MYTYSVRIYKVRVMYYKLGVTLAKLSLIPYVSIYTLHILLDDSILEERKKERERGSISLFPSTNFFFCFPLLRITSSSVAHNRHWDD